MNTAIFINEALRRHVFTCQILEEGYSIERIYKKYVMRGVGPNNSN